MPGQRRIEIVYTTPNTDETRRRILSIGEASSTAMGDVRRSSLQGVEALERVGSVGEATGRRFVQMGNQVRSTGASMAAALGDLDRDFDQLRRSIDPSYAALKQYEQQQALVAKAVLYGATSQKTANDVLARAGAEYKRAAAGVAVAAQNYRQSGAVIQQAGYQVGDFAVQVAGGQNAIRAFTQQGTQLLQFFGPWGSVLGAAAAIVGAVAVSLFDAEESASDLDEELADLGRSARQATQDFVDFRREIDDLTTAQRGLLGVNVAQQLIELQDELPALDAKLDRVGGAFRRVLQFDSSKIQEFATYTGAAEADLLALAQAGAKLSALSPDEDINALANAVAQFVAANPGAIEKMGGDLSNLLATLRAVGGARDSVQRLEKALKALGESAGGVRAATDEQIKHAQRIADTVEGLEQEIENERLLNAALADGSIAFSDIGTVREGYLAVQRLGIKALSDEGREIIGLIDALAAEKAVREQLERERAGADHLAELATENQVLRLRIEHGEDEVLVLQEQSKLRERLGRDLLPQEVAQVRRLVEEQGRLTDAIARAEAEAKAYEEAWSNAVEDIQKTLTDSFEEALAGNIRSFEDFSDAVMGIVRRLAANILAQQIVVPITTSVAGSLGIPGFGGATGAAAANGTGGIFGSLFGGGGGFNPLSSVVSNFGGSFLPSTSSIIQGLSPLTNAIGITQAVTPTIISGTTAGSAAIGGYGGTAFGGAAGAGSGVGAGSLAGIAGPAALAALAAIAAYQMGFIGPGPTSGPVGISHFRPGLGADGAFDLPGIDTFTADNGGDPRASEGVSRALVDRLDTVAEDFGATIATNFDLRIASYASPEGGNSKGRVQGFELNALVEGEAEKRIAEGLSEQEALFEGLKYVLSEHTEFQSETLEEVLRNTQTDTADALLADLQFGQDLDYLRAAIGDLGGVVDQNTLAQAQNTVAIRQQADEFASTAIEPILTALQKAVELFPAVGGAGDAAAANDNVAAVARLAEGLAALEFDHGAIRGQQGYSFTADNDETIPGIGTIGTPAGDFTVSQTGSTENGDNFAVMDQAGEVVDTFRSLAAALAHADDFASVYAETLAEQADAAARTAEEQERYNANLDRVGFAVDVAKAEVQTLVDTITGDFEPGVRGPFASALQTGQAELDALRDHLTSVNDEITAANEAFPELGQTLIDVTATITDAQTALLENLRTDYQDSQTARRNTAGGLGIINQIDALLDQRAADAGDAAALGLDVNSTAGETYNQELFALLQNASVATLGQLLSSDQVTDAQTRAVIELRLQEQALTVARTEQATELDGLTSSYERLAAVSARLRSAAQGLLVDSDLSPLSIEDQIAVAAREVERLNAVANDNTPDDAESLAAAESLEGAVRAWLELERAYNASNEVYAEAFQRGQDILNGTAARQESIERQMLTRMTEVRDLLADGADAGPSYGSGYAAGAGGQYLSDTGFDLGANPAANLAILDLLSSAGLPLPTGFGEGQLNALRSQNAAVDAVLRAAGYADGGSFTVAGGPGTDTLMAPPFRVSSGEAVNISTRDTMSAVVRGLDRVNDNLRELRAEHARQSVSQLRMSAESGQGLMTGLATVADGVSDVRQALRQIQVAA